MAFRVFLSVLWMFADMDRNYKDFVLKCVLNSIDHIVWILFLAYSVREDDLVRVFDEY